MMKKPVYILGIESSCDETAAAVSVNGKILANIICSQEVHKAWQGVVPELASRAHQQNIVPTVDSALKKAGVTVDELSAIAFTRGPGLIGSLLVGTSFAKAMAMALAIPLIEVHHMQAHILAHFIKDDQEPLRKFPPFPFLCLTVSGGHTQIVKVSDFLDMEILGETTDDAAGEAFDKAAKIMGLPYPGGPLIDKYAAGGNPHRFKFPLPQVAELDFSFSGLKTAFLYFIRDHENREPGFTEKNRDDICASIQHTIIEILIRKVTTAVEKTGITQVALAGGVSANSGLRKAMLQWGESRGGGVYIPRFEYCTDNAAMIAIAGHYKYLAGKFTSQQVSSLARMAFLKNA